MSFPLQIKNVDRSSVKKNTLILKKNWIFQGIFIGLDYGPGFPADT